MIPASLPKKYRSYWLAPWNPKAARSPGFRFWLARHGYLSPHFTLREAACKNGTALPLILRPGARAHAFRLEAFRHAIGDRRLQPLSWYRTPAYNAQIGGARFSRHMRGDACDFSRQTVEVIGRARFMAAANKVFADHGIGVYPAGSVHLDSRPFRARWNSWSR